MNASMSSLLSHLLPYIGGRAGLQGDIKYCEGCIGYDWKNPNPKVPLRTRHPREYEDKLDRFIGSAASRPLAATDYLMILVGGTGTGKSTAVAHALARVSARTRDCTRAGGSERKCSLPFRRIVLDFNEWCEDYCEPEEEVRESDLWNFVAAHIVQGVGTELSARDEVEKFWPWALRQSKVLALSAELNRFFHRIQPKLTSLLNSQPFAGWSGEALLESLLRERDALFMNISSSTHAWYSVLRLLYDIQSVDPARCSCTVFVVDNVDHLDPRLQRMAVQFALHVASIGSIKTLIAIRPLTWERSVHGNILIEVQHHYGPRPLDVIMERLDACLKKEPLDQAEILAITALKKALSNDSSILGKLLATTSGLSIRYAQRNLENMLQSPLLAGATVDDKFLSTAGGEFKVSDLARAFFFCDENAILNQSFDNLYVVGGLRTIERSLVKPRILDLICRVHGYRCSVAEIFTFCALFGYDRQVVTTALDEMLMRSRALLWSEDGLRIRNCESRGRLMVTPIGVNYYEQLFGELMYDEVCLAERRDDSVPLNRIYSFHVELSDQDMKEIKRCAEEHGALVYRSFYPGDYGGLSLTHFKRLWPGLRRREKSGIGDVVFDPAREAWLRNRIQHIVGD